MNKHELCTLNEVEDYEQRREMKKVICRLTDELRAKYSYSGIIPNLYERQIMLITKIENIVLNLATDIIENKKNIAIILHKKSWENCVFNEVLRRKSSMNCTKSEIKLRDKQSQPKFSIICYLLGKIYKLLKTQQICTKRELYYRNVEVLNSQNLVDSVLNEISCLLDAPLYDLNVYTTSKGLIYGQVILKTSAEETDCSSVGGTLIPNDVSDITDIKTDASFVLLIEKDTIFQRLLDDTAMKSLPPCIFVTGKGFPDINTRILLRKMWNILAIPILALVDPDPWGIEIMCIYRFGSLSMAHEGEQLAVPSIRWLGVFPSEAGSLSTAHIALSPKDRKHIDELLRRPYAYAAPRLANELHTAAFKAETENVDVPRGYLAHKYIPSKIAAADFI